MALDTTTFQALVFAGTSIGAIGRTMLPYLQKLKESEERGEDPPSFQKKYVFSFVYGLAISLGVSMTLFSSVVGTIDAAATIPSIMILSGLAGWGSGSIVNNVIKIRAKGKETETETETEEQQQKTRDDSD